MKKFAFVFFVIAANLSLQETGFAQLSAEPELPRTYLQTAYAPPSGQRRVLAAGGDLQATLNAAQPGDTIELAAGATFVGNFTLPTKTGTAWIYIQSASLGALPPEGTRVGPQHAALMPKILTHNSMPALRMAAGAHHYRLVGIELGITSSNTLNYSVLRLGEGAQDSLAEVPHDLVIDRCYLHGAPSVSVKRGVELNSASTAIVDSYLSDFHVIGQEAQAIAGWAGPGPFKIVNNYLQGAGENIFFGGADTRITNLVPSDIEIRGNHLHKPLSWNPRHPSYAGRRWSVKNSFELKNARRVLVEGNMLENNWVDGQNGFAIVLTPRNTGGTNPWSTVEDVTIRHNIVRHTAGGMNILGRSDIFPAQQLKRVRIENNVFEDVGNSMWGGGGRLYQVLSGTADVTITHNTAFQTGTVVSFDGSENTRFVYTNNIGPRGTYGVFGTGSQEGTATLQDYTTSYEFEGNALVGGTASRYPAGNLFPADMDAMQFEDLDGGNYRLAATSPGHNAATDGTDVGADIDALEAVMGGSAPPPPPTEEFIITSVSASGITTSSADIGWLTNEPSNTQIEYGVTPAYGNLSNLAPALVTSHAQTVEGLAANTLYYYRARSRDADGNSAVSDMFTFRTAGGADTSAPTISAVGVSSITTASAMISWTTNEGSNTQVEYGLSSQPYSALTPINGALVTAHSQLLSGLQPNTVYHYRVKSRDAAGNLATSGDFSFRTAAVTQPVTTGTGLKGQYFDSTDLTILRMTRTNSTVNFNWGLGTPAPTISGSFSVRWTGQVQALYSQVYTFYTTTDDGVRLWVNGRLLIDDWRGHTATTNAGIPITLVAGTKYDIRMEYFDNAGAASAKLEWSSASQPRQVVPQSQLYPAP